MNSGGVDNGGEKVSGKHSLTYPDTNSTIDGFLAAVPLGPPGTGTMASDSGMLVCVSGDIFPIAGIEELFEDSRKIKLIINTFPVHVVSLKCPK